jgi:peptide/nickel transport system permease protein
MKKRKKLLNFIFTCFFTLIAIFFLGRFAPGDPIERILGPEASFEEIQGYKKDLGLNLPLAKQFSDFVKNVVRGDLGNSLFKREKVVGLLIKHFRPTLKIAFFTIFFSTILGIFLGVLSAEKKSTKLDHSLRLLTLVALSLPIFSLGPILVYLFAVKFQFFPVSEWGNGEIKYLILPVLTLVIPLSAILSRFTRNKYLEESKGQWIEVLKAKGMSNYSIQLRVLKICSPSIINVIAIQLSVILAGTMITETIFDIPGMGSLLLESIENRDYPVIQGVVLYSTVIYMLIYFSADLICEKLDPRISE